jgi:hypothetical protein
MNYIRNKTRDALCPRNLRRRTCDMEMWREYIKAREELVKRIVQLDDFIHV